MYVIIVGGGKVGFFLTKALHEAGHEVAVIERLERRYQAIVEDLGELVLFGDGCDVRTLEAAGVARADVLVAATGDDEDNLVSAQLAKTKFHVPRTIARVNNPRNEEVFRLLGVDDTVSATRILLSLIEHDLEVDVALPLFPARPGNVDLLELHVRPDGPAAGKRVEDLHLPTGCLLAVVLRDGAASLANKDTILRPHDTLLAFAPPELAETVRQAVVGRSSAP